MKTLDEWFKELADVFREADPAKCMAAISAIRIDAVESDAAQRARLRETLEKIEAEADLFNDEAGDGTFNKVRPLRIYKWAAQALNEQDPKAEAIDKIVRAVLNWSEQKSGGLNEHFERMILHAAAEYRAAGSGAPASTDPEAEALAKDAARYRWLRRQHWSVSSIACVMNPKEAVRVGHDCPSLELLDSVIDTSMDRKGGAHAG